MGATADAVDVATRRGVDGVDVPASGEKPHLKGIGPLKAETFPMQPTIIGLDLAKTVFQVHGVDAAGKIVLTKRLRRDGVLTFFANLPTCVVGMEACATAHHWGREITKLGHTVRLMPPQYVKP